MYFNSKNILLNLNKSKITAHKVNCMPSINISNAQISQIKHKKFIGVFLVPTCCPGTTLLIRCLQDYYIEI